MRSNSLLKKFEKQEILIIINSPFLGFFKDKMKQLIILTIAIVLVGCDNRTCLKSHSDPICVCISVGNNICVPELIQNDVCDLYEDKKENE